MRKLHWFGLVIASWLLILSSLSIWNGSRAINWMRWFWAFVGIAEIFIGTFIICEIVWEKEHGETK
jgi:hypothetical protein